YPRSLELSRYLRDLASFSLRGAKYNACPNALALTRGLLNLTRVLNLAESFGKARELAAGVMRATGNHGPVQLGLSGQRKAAALSRVGLLAAADDAVHGDDVFERDLEQFSRIELLEHDLHPGFFRQPLDQRLRRFTFSLCPH